MIILEAVKYRFRNYPLQKKLIAVIMLVSTIVICASFILFVANEARSYWKVEKEKLSALADIVAKNSAAAITFKDQKAAEDTLSGLSGNTHIIAAVILSADGSVFARYSSANITQGRKQLISGTAEASMNDDGLASLWDWDSAMKVARPVMLDEQMIGKVIITSDRDELLSRFKSFSYVTVIIMMCSFLLAYLISVRLQRLISQPILDIVQTMKMVSADKKYSLRVEKRSDDELGTLTQGFNDMLEQIQSRDIALQNELAERKRAEEQIRLLAYYDSLTGLPNRTFFKQLTSRALLQAERMKQVMAFLFIDLDNFKHVNDTLGHDIGDQLLRDIPKIILKCLRKSDLMARLSENEIRNSLSRLGGDEFVLFLPSIADAQDAAAIARRILAEMQSPFLLSGTEVFVTASIGISIYPHDGADVDTLLKNSDMAMYYAKSKGKNNYLFYAESMNVTMFERMKLENELRRALERDEFVLYYQPIIDVAKQRITGLEALIRWKHPEKGLVSPGLFIPLAEESRLIVSIGEWALRTACLQNANWQKKGLPPINIAVNLSGRHFEELALFETIEKILEETQLDPGYLELEITESAIMKNPEGAISTLNRIMAAGIKISIDDFGTGYSSLSYLRKLPLHSLKIDRSFINEIPSNQEDIKIVRAIIALAHGLHLRVIAEGVETDEQSGFLQASGCDEMQGFLWSRPVPAEEVTDLWHNIQGNLSSAP